MTDNEIIKALDICGHLEACADCPLGYLEGVDKCMHTLLLNALDLINRQKEDIDELDAIVDLRSKRKYYQKFVTEVYQKEKGNELSAPDFDYVYELYFKQKAEIERLTQLAELGNMRANDYRAMRDKLKVANAEIERLQSVNADMQESLRLAAEANKDMQAEVDRYKKYYETMKIEIYSFRKDQAEVKFLKNKIRAEAIKEFAERLKEAFSDLEFEYDPKLRIVKVEEVKSLVDWALHKISIETIQDAAKDISGN